MPASTRTRFATARSGSSRRGRGTESAECRAHRERVPADPDEAPARPAVSRLVGRPRLRDRPHEGRRLRRGPRRVRLHRQTTKTRKALWVELPPVLAEALEASLGPREDRDPDARPLCLERPWLVPGALPRRASREASAGLWLR